MAKFMRKCWDARYIYLLLLPGLVFIAIFSYGPMYGIQLAFRQFHIRAGITNSPWVGLRHFRFMFSSPEFFTAVRNTVMISLGRIVFEFPFPIFLAILLSELRLARYRRVLQTIYTFPFFLSWVIVAAIMITFFDSQGPVNAVIMRFTGERIPFLGSQALFRPMLYGTQIWRDAGWGTIIYLAAITGINPELYEAAALDGAGRLQRIWYITIPSIMPVIALLFILALGNIMGGGFDQIFNMINPVVRPVGETLPVYVWRITFERPPDFGFSTAVGLFSAVINFTMLLIADRIVRLISGHGLFK